MIVIVKLSRKENISYYNSEAVELDIEEYLKGVVSSEIGNAHIEACAAQAIAARTFALQAMNGKGYITDKSSIDQAFSVTRFSGYPNAYLGIEKTNGQVLYYNGKLAKCYYSASNGGQTTSSKERWGGDYPYLISQKDSFDNKKRNGHGVGLSQTGAKNRANAGHTYQQILSFYFPNTNINKIEGEKEEMTKVEYLLNWMTSKIGSPYIYGGTQKDCTPAYRRQQMSQYPEYSSSIKSNCQVLRGNSSSCKNCKWYDNENNKPKKAYDCAQFVRRGAAAVGIDNVVSGATSQWKSNIWEEKGVFSKIPSNKLCCVFRDKGGVKQHVGWYYNGYAYHAQGHATGVVKTDNKQYKSWTHYAILKGLYDSNDNPILLDKDLENNLPEVIKVLYNAYVAVEDGSTLNFRAGPSTKNDIISRIPKGAKVDVIEVSGDWSKIIYNNEIGYVKNDFLIKEEIPENNKVKEYYVKIKCSSENEAKQLATLLKSAVAE